MRTRQEFVERFRTHLAGLALFGTVSAVKDGPMARAAKVLDIPDEVDKLLNGMYDFMEKAPTKTAERKQA